MEGYKIGYVTNDRIPYRKVLIILLIPIDSITNIHRTNIINKQHAKYRCNKAYVKDIKDTFDNSYNSAISKFYRNKLIYQKNKIVESDFDPDINIVSTYGIHFFLDKDTALNYREPILYQVWENEINVFKEFYENGQIHKIIYYILSVDKKTIVNKKIKEYFDSGQIRFEYSLNINKYDGLYREWYENGVLKTKLTYNNNKVVSYLENWDVRGNKL